MNPLLLAPEPPSFVVPPQSVEALPGSDVTFSAMVKGSAPLKLKWFRGAKELEPSPACSFSLKSTNQVVLDLSNVGKSQAGEYTCQIINEAGKESWPVTLTIKGRSIRTSSHTGPMCLKQEAFQPCFMETEIVAVGAFYGRIEHNYLINNNTCRTIAAERVFSLTTLIMCPDQNLQPSPKS